MAEEKITNEGPAAKPREDDAQRSLRVRALQEKAERMMEEADCAEKVNMVIAVFQEVLELEPDNYESLWRLGALHLMMAGSYLTRKDAKVAGFSRALDFCERAMRTVPAFNEMRQNGTEVWDAVGVLTADQLGGMWYWTSSYGQLWAESFGPLGKLLTVYGRSRRLKKVMDRMLELDPDWHGGHPCFLAAHYYESMPRLLGGDMEQSRELYDRAVAAGPNWLYIKYYRALYHHTRTGDKKAFKDDLEWVLSQDPKKADSPYAANIYFQQSGRKMLANIENYF